MLLRHRLRPADGYRSPEQNLDALILRMRRLAVHKGYDRSALMSPMLTRIMPARRKAGDPAAEMDELRRRLDKAGLDAKAVAYLTESVEVELDFARLRLT